MKRTVIIFVFLSLFISVGFRAFAQDASQEKEKDFIYTLLSPEGKVIPDVESNSVLVVDRPANVEMVAEYLQMADAPGPQVLIEARVVEVQLEKEHSMGVNWSILEQNALKMGEFSTFSGAPGTLPTQELPFRSPKWEPFFGDDQDPFSLGIFNDKIDIVMKMLTTQLDTEIISAPKVTTTNNRRAKIDVIKTIPFLAEVQREEEETQGGGLRVTFTYVYDYADEGVSLDVTPLVNPDGSISMVLVPLVKEIVRFREMVRPDGADRAPELPETDVRVAQTKVTIQEGQTLVIGGLIREKVKAGQTKVPFLGDIPLLGKLFRSDLTTTKKTELLIFVSPTIINPRVIASMKREETYGLGKGYTQRQKKYHDGMIELENRQYIPLLDNLSSEVKSLIQERKSLEKEIYKTKKQMRSLPD